MSFVGDAVGFEKFFAKDFWKNLRHDPKRLILGVDPASTWGWNKILGRHDQPLVDQMGGPFNGKVLSWGDTGGVYKRAQDAGIDTGAASSMHKIAHVVASMFGAQGLSGIGGGSGGAGGGTSAYGPYSSGYQWAPGSEYGASSGFGSLGGLGTSSGPEGITLAGGAGSGVTAPAGSGASPYQSRSLPQQQDTQQQPTRRDQGRYDQIANMIADQQAGGRNNPLWNAPPAMETPPAAMQDPYAKMKAALLKQQLEQAGLGFSVPGSPYG